MRYTVIFLFLVVSTIYRLQGAALETSIRNLPLYKVLQQEDLTAAEALFAQTPKTDRDILLCFQEATRDRSLRRQYTFITCRPCYKKGQYDRCTEHGNSYGDSIFYSAALYLASKLPNNEETVPPCDMPDPIPTSYIPPSLWLATRFGHPNVVQYLLQKSQNIRVLRASTYQALDERNASIFNELCNAWIRQSNQEESPATELTEYALKNPVHIPYLLGSGILDPTTLDAEGNNLWDYMTSFGEDQCEYVKTFHPLVASTHKALEKLEWALRCLDDRDRDSTSADKDEATAKKTIAIQEFKKLQEKDPYHLVAYTMFIRFFYGRWPSWWSTWDTTYKMMHILLEENLFPPDTQDIRTGETALHQALTYNRSYDYSTMLLFLAYGTDYTKKDYSGCTAFQKARKKTKYHDPRHDPNIQLLTAYEEGTCLDPDWSSFPGLYGEWEEKIREKLEAQGKLKRPNDMPDSQQGRWIWPCTLI